MAGSTAHLFAGPGIMLKGEIAGCDTLRVEGVVDGNAAARQLIVSKAGGSWATRKSRTRKSKAVSTARSMSAAGFCCAATGGSRVI